MDAKQLAKYEMRAKIIKAADPLPEATHVRFVSCLSVIAVAVGPAAGQADPFGDLVSEYVPGTDPTPGYDDPTTTLGPPNRCTSYGVVSPFNPAFETTEIVSIGAGGSLTVAFAAPVVDDPANPFGVDLLVFSNAGFVDASLPDGIVGGLISDGGLIEVSADGTAWVPVPGAIAEGLFPTLSYLDSGPYDFEPGSMPTSFTRPVDPSLTLADLLGFSVPELVLAYGGSGGGVGIDLSPLGLEAISFVRVVVPEDSDFNVEIDAFADVAPAVAGDVNGDGVVDVTDLVSVINGWGAMGELPSDVNNDGLVNVTDLLLVIVNWSDGGGSVQ